MYNRQGSDLMNRKYVEGFWPCTNFRVDWSYWGNGMHAGRQENERTKKMLLVAIYHQKKKCACLYIWIYGFNTKCTIKYHTDISQISSRENPYARLWLYLTLLVSKQWQFLFCSFFFSLRSAVHQLNKIGNFST